MKRCPFCTAEIHEAAVVCEHCGRNLTPDSEIVAATEPGRQDATAAGAPQTALGYLVVIFVVLFGSCWYILTPDDSPEAEVERALRNARAITAAICEMEMTARLPSPESADYPFGQVAAVQALGQDRFRLRSYVDSQNALGALVRTEFDCIVSGTGVEFNAYTLVSFEVG